MPLSGGCRVLRAPRGQRPASWMSPALASHQQLDAGIAARAQTDRKNLKKSKRPFENYFKTTFTRSAGFSLPTTRSDGVLAGNNYAAVKLMTDPTVSWETPWGRARGWGGVRYRNKRQDVRELPGQAFGEDPLDVVIRRLVDVRFDWDKADEILANGLVPPMLYRFTAHSVPFAFVDGRQSASGSHGATDAGQWPAEMMEEWRKSEAAAADAHSSEQATSRSAARLDDHAAQRKVLRNRISSFARKHGFSGVNAIPSLVLDASRGPLLSSPDASDMTWRWMAANKDAAMVSDVLKDKQRIAAMTLLAIPQESVLLLVKALSTFEVGDPPTETALAIAVGEHYFHFSRVERLELLRCLRRVALVRHARHTEGESPLEDLYRDPTLAPAALGQYLLHDAKFLIGKVWADMPEHIHYLIKQRYYLDLHDYLSLAMEAAGQRIPRNLPNAATKAPYASKSFFLRYTLGLDEKVVREMIVSMCPAAGPAIMEADPLSQQGELEVAPLAAVSPPTGSTSSGLADGEEAEKVLWLCASLWIHLVADSVGAVLRHVERSLREHARMAEELLVDPSTSSKRDAQRRRDMDVEREKEVERLLTQVSPGRPFHRVYQSIGKHRPKLMRLQLMPLDAFPAIASLMAPPFVRESLRVRDYIQKQYRPKRASAASVRGSETPPAASASTTQVLATVLSASEVLAVHVDRACGTLEWASSILSDWTIALRVCRGQSNSNSDGVSSRPLHDMRSATTPAASGAVDVSSPYEKREELCASFVGARVRHSVDCLFTLIPWLEIQDRLLLDAHKGSEDAETDEESSVSTNYAEANAAERESKHQKEEEAMDEAADGNLFLRFLDDPSPPGQETEAPKLAEQPAEESSAPVLSPELVEESEEIISASEKIQKLQENISRFQVAVAALVSECEKSFPSYYDSSSAEGDRESSTYDDKGDM